MIADLDHAPAGFDWPLCPEAAAFIAERIRAFLDRHAFAAELARRMTEETSTRFFDWVDYLSLPEGECDEAQLQRIGFAREEADTPPGCVSWRHPHAQLPRLLIGAGATPGAALAADDVVAFQIAHGLSLPIEGAPLSALRYMRVPEGAVALTVVERRG